MREGYCGLCGRRGPVNHEGFCHGCNKRLEDHIHATPEEKKAVFNEFFTTAVPIRFGRTAP